MKIEKINENQIKFILSQSDLTERGINIAELVTSSEKTHSLLREMMDAAMNEFDFQTDGTPLMIEAMPISAESVTIIVTKISNMEDFEEKLNLLPKALKKEKAAELPVKLESGHVLIYAFTNFDDAAAAGARLNIEHYFESNLYKIKNIYYLIIEDKNQLLNLEQFELILSEYGERQLSTELSQYHIYEHGEPVIKQAAIEALKKYFLI